MFCGAQSIEKHARHALRNAVIDVDLPSGGRDLPQPFKDVLKKVDADPIGDLIGQIPFDWAPPQTSNDPNYTKLGVVKVHVELLGPDGLVKSDQVRLGLYGMFPNAEYGVRTHPAEETFVMLAGKAYWKHGSASYKPLVPGERSYHPSMLPHATLTKDEAFMSAYVWHGDISTDNYVYQGLPND